MFMAKVGSPERSLRRDNHPEQAINEDVKPKRIYIGLACRYCPRALKVIRIPFIEKLEFQAE
jgi:hypothetical protein